MARRIIDVSRRGFLLGTASLAAAAMWSDRALGITLKNVNLADNPFQLGVASGDPDSKSVVIWTRLAPKPLEGGGMPSEAVEVSWQVGDDEGMTKIVREGTTTATPEWGHSVHVEVDGLAPDRWYFFRFKAAGELSPIGRTRTMPTIETVASKMRFAFASCQHWESGLYTAYEHMAQDGLDLVVHLGDYIYEGKGRPDGLRTHVGPEINTLDDYRNRHAQYKTDIFLQAMHQQVPWIVTWDDHEFDNNCAADISEETNVKKEDFLARRASAYQAYYEHMPLRKACLPKGPDMLLYRRLHYGNLATFDVLDTRQYRSDQPCGDGNKPQCPEALDPKQTLLGEKQEKWLLDGLATTKSKWNILAQQVMMARSDRKAGPEQTFSMDQWPGYEINRRRLLKAFDDLKVPGPVVLTGDIHTNWANNLIADFDNLDSKVVASEFVGTSISSGGNGAEATPSVLAAIAENPFVKFHNAERGYVRCEVTPEKWTTDFCTVPYVDRPGAPLVKRASFVVEQTKPGIESA